MRRTPTLIILLLIATSAPAQQVNDVRDLVPSGAEFGGQAEVFSEAYSVSGRDARRPSGTARLFLRPYLRFGEAFELSADVLLSTEQQGFGGSARQRINRLGIRPAWAWGWAALGDFSHGYTSLTYQGIPVRGGAIDLHPGWFRLNLLGGVTQRAVAGEATNGTFGRQLYAGRIGIGETDGSYFDIIALYADDDVGSLEQEPVFDDPDTNQVGTIAPTSVTPQENLVLGAAAQINAFDRSLVWHGEVNGAAYTRDKRASEIDESELQDVPSWLTSLFTPRNGSNLDYAWSTDLRLRLPHWDLRSEYTWVGPGYRSLGVGSLLVNRQVLRSRMAFQSQRVSANVHGSRQRDNVLQQKRDTTYRNTIALMVSVRARDDLLTTFQTNLNTMVRDTANPDQRIDYLNQVWSIGARLSLQRRLIRSTGVQYRLQTAVDENPARRASEFTSHQIVFPVALQLSRSLQLTPHLGVVWARNPRDGWSTTHTEKLALRHSTVGRRWVSTLSGGTSFDDGSRRFVLSLNSTWRASERTSLRFVVRNNVYRARGAAPGDWEEWIGRLSVENRW